MADGKPEYAMSRATEWKSLTQAIGSGLALLR